MDELRGRMEQAFRDLQDLDIKPTERNLIYLLSVQGVMKDAYAALFGENREEAPVQPAPPVTEEATPDGDGETDE